MPPVAVFDAEIGQWVDTAVRRFKNLNFEKRFEKQQDGHVSISNSACFEATRKKGGRTGFVSKAVYDWL